MPVDILAIEENLRSANEAISLMFNAATDIADAELAKNECQSVASIIEGIREKQLEIVEKWRSKRAERKGLLELYAERGRIRFPRASSGG